MRKKNLFWFYFSFLSVLELVNHFLIYQSFTFVFLLFLFPFIMSISLLLTGFSRIFTHKTNTFLTNLFCFCIVLSFGVNFIYYALFSVPFSISTLGLASQAFDFVSIALKALWDHIFVVFFFLFLFFFFVFRTKKYCTTKALKKELEFYFGGSFVMFLFILLCLFPFKGNLYGPYSLFYEIDDLYRSISIFGFLPSEAIDIQRRITGFSGVLMEEEKEIVQEEVDKYHLFDLDFSILKNGSTEEAQLADYLESRMPTKENEYTGLLKGKNLIFILAEGFNSIAVDKDRTPTLYQMIHTGLTFENFYSPVFLSTTGGEFQAMTSLIPTQEILSLWRNNTPTFSYALGNAFSKEGYRTQSYHDWTYTYYGRDKTMSTFGFSNYTACGNGLEKEISCKWLPLDSDMMRVTVPKYSENDPFVTYYITVSGHAPYNFTGGNSTALKYQSEVNDLPYSNSVKAYLASQMELENAMRVLLSELEERGILNDTVIALVGDHYPYTLSTSEINEIAQDNRDGIIGVNKSEFIIYHPSLPEKTISKVGSQIDILPTLLNLFGISYDSRLLMGKDILSDSEGLAIFSDRSWVSERGMYFASDNTFLGNASEEYITQMNQRIANAFTMSKSIVKYNIYKKLLEE